MIFIKKLYILILIGIMLLVGCKDKDPDLIEDDPHVEDNKNDQEGIIDEEIEAQELDRPSEEVINILFYMGKLKDKEFTSTYGDVQEPSTWYTAAEELGIIGKPAIPYLIKNLETRDSYEKGLTLYALLLASQDEELMEQTNGNYIDAGLTFNQEEQIEYTQKALVWWDEYKNLF